jgi:hypothetical protein
MRQIRGCPQPFSYPIAPKLVLLEQPWHLVRDNWSADDPTRARSMFEELLAYSKKMGIPVFSSQSSKAHYQDEGRFSKKHGITPIRIQAVSARGYVLDDVIDPNSFISRLLDSPGCPIIVGGAHARTAYGNAFGKMIEHAGLNGRILDGICILEPLRFLISLKESGLLGSSVFLDPRLTIQIGGPVMDEARLYEVVGSVPDSESFRIRPSAHL